MNEWYLGEPWVKDTPAYKAMQFTRKLHKVIRTKLSELSKNQIDAACTFENPWCPDRELLLKDFADACPFEKVGQRPYKFLAELSSEQKYFTTFELAITQCTFVSLIILHPKEFGVHDATDEDLEAFCHMWRCYGYYLGLEDEYVLPQTFVLLDITQIEYVYDLLFYESTFFARYNFCRGSLDEIKQRTRDLHQYWVLPNLKEITPEWEHITRCLVEPFNFNPAMKMSYKAAMLFTVESLGANMPRLYASLRYSEWIVYYCWK